MPITATNPRSACPYGIPNCQLLLGLSYALDSPSSKFQIMPSWTNDLHKLLRAAEFSSACKLSISMLPNSTTAYPPDEFSCLAWTFYCPAHVRQQSVLSISFDEPIAAQICVADLSH
jgi:hypothetical protein